MKHTCVPAWASHGLCHAGSLRHLSLDFGHVFIPEISTMLWLHSLDLRSNLVEGGATTVVGVSPLSSLQQLRDLCIDFSDARVTGLRMLAQSCPHLVKLSVTAGGVLPSQAAGGLGAHAAAAAAGGAGQGAGAAGGAGGQGPGFSSQVKMEVATLAGLCHLAHLALRKDAGVSYMHFGARAAAAAAEVSGFEAIAVGCTAQQSLRLSSCTFVAASEQERA